MQLDLKLCAGKYKRITGPQLRGADCKSAPAACFEQRICISGGAGVAGAYIAVGAVSAIYGTATTGYDIYYEINGD